jgi:hypothetical protein
MDHTPLTGVITHSACAACSVDGPHAMAECGMMLQEAVRTAYDTPVTPPKPPAQESA